MYYWYNFINTSTNIYFSISHTSIYICMWKIIKSIFLKTVINIFV